jgi:hypothetical protein
VGRRSYVYKGIHFPAAVLLFLSSSRNILYIYNTTSFISHLVSLASLSSFTSCQAFLSLSSWCQVPIPAISLSLVANHYILYHTLTIHRVAILSKLAATSKCISIPYYEFPGFHLLFIPHPPITFGILA